MNANLSKTTNYKKYIVYRKNAKRYCAGITAILVQVFPTPNFASSSKAARSNHILFAVLLVLLAVRVEHIIRVRAGILVGLGARVEGDLSRA